jgi:pyruvate dehydrogenase E2 component (dihydrolipoamide acetyltransferase)
MPALGADMESGRVVEWLVKAGDHISPGTVVAVVETHKGAIDVECFLDGVVEDLAPLDQDLPVGAVLARVRVAGESRPATAVPPAASAPGQGQAAPLAPQAVASPRASPAVPPLAPPAVATAALSTTLPAAGEPAPAPRSRRSRVTPAARRRAAELGVAVATMAGSATDGAVTLADVERAAAATVPPGAGVPATARVPRRTYDPTQMRQAIAVAMARSKREIPHYYLGTTIDFAAARSWLDTYNAQRDPAERLLPAVLLLKATARALAEVPQLNGFYTDGAFQPGQGIHPGWAIALRGGGLVAPAVHAAGERSLPELMAMLRDLVQRARTGSLRSSEITDPTVTITSLGDRGAESVLGVIYPPQVAIVGFGRIVERPWVVAGQVVARPVVAATLAADHRASDGHLGGLLLAAIDRALQAPGEL